MDMVMDKLETLKELDKIMVMLMLLLMIKMETKFITMDKMLDHQET